MTPQKSSLALFLVLIFLSFSCGQKTTNDSKETESITDEKASEKILFDEVMAVHDEVMPKMQDIMNLKEQLTKKLDEIKADAPNSEMIVEFENTIVQLDKADESMMNWMRNFDPNIKDKSHEEIIQYYTNQKTAVDSVKIIMESAISDASELVNSDQ